MDGSRPRLHLGRAGRAVAADATAFDDQIATAEISATFRIAHRAYKAAVPAVALCDLDARVEDIFDE